MVFTFIIEHLLFIKLNLLFNDKCNDYRLENWNLARAPF